MAAEAPPLQLDGAVAVVTGGAGGIGRGIVGALLRRGAAVVIADVEAAAIESAVADLHPLGKVSGQRVDITDEDAVAALADAVYDEHGRLNLLFNNAGVTSGGGGKPWQQEPNDWRWCFGVNVFGTAICTSTFVPRMIEGGEPGQVVNTSSGDGGFAPVPMASVYAASKAAVSCFTCRPRSTRCCGRPSSTRRAASCAPACSPPPATARTTWPAAARPRAARA